MPRIIQSQKWKIFAFLFFGWSFVLAQPSGSFLYTPTPFSAVILGQASINGVLADQGDWIGVFDEVGNCAGAAEINLFDGRSDFSLTIYGDDPATVEIDEGLTESESFTLQLFDSSSTEMFYHEENYWEWKDTQGQFLDLFTPDSILSLVNSLKINQLQVIGSHNSYRMAPSDTLFMVLEILAPDLVYAWDYTHITLDDQFLYYGIRQVELDVYHDPEGGLFSTRLGSYMIGDSIYAEIDELDEPGMKVLHFPDIDFETHYFSFKSALEEIKVWSNTYPLHVPIFILVEAKSEGLEDYAEEYPELQPFLNNFPYPPVSPLTFDLEALNSLEQEIIDVFGDRMDKIITPDVVRSNYGTLEAAVLDGAWPTLGESRGKIMFGLDNGGSLMEDYMDGYPSLSGRIMFVEANPGTPEAAFLGMNTPSDEISVRVSEGYLVRTRSDTDTEEARSGDTSRREEALESGAHFISTDYYRPDLRHEIDTAWTDYSVRLPGDYFTRVNPVNGPSELSSLELDLVNFNKIFDFTPTVNIEKFGFILPIEFILHQNYPNPFNPTTTIWFEIPFVQTRHAVSLRIYDIAGRLIETLFDEEMEPGNHTVQWNATGFSSGVYFVRLQSGNYLQTQKILLMK